MVKKRNSSTGWIVGKSFLAFVLPPLSVGLTTGPFTRPWGVNLALTLLGSIFIFAVIDLAGFVGAPIHALYIIFKYKDRDYIRHSHR